MVTAEELIAAAKAEANRVKDQNMETLAYTWVYGQEKTYSDVMTRWAKRISILTELEELRLRLEDQLRATQLRGGAK